MEKKPIYFKTDKTYIFGITNSSKQGKLTLAIEEHTIHGNSRIGIFKRNEARSRGYTLYELTDHLGNVRAVIQKSTLGPAAIVSSTTDYYPFGMPMPNKHYHR